MVRDFLGLAGKNLLITGASSGIGKVTAIRASQHGARVVLVGRRVDALRETFDSLEGTGHTSVEADLLNLEGIPAMVREGSLAMGGLDGLVHAAGTWGARPLRSIETDLISSTFDLNVTAAIMLLKGFRHKGVHRAGASVVLLSSAVGLVGQPGVSVYSASKGAVVALTKSLALELAREDIRVNCVCPGVVQTPMADDIANAIGHDAFERVAAQHPLGLGHAQDIANANLFLLSSASRWVTGSALVVDGGYTAQ
jgi:3-oxoacyl-[acyl-carrier protein] reductase